MKAFLVGGAVRDILLRLPVKDRDWVVIGATPEMMLAQGFQQVGRDFPVFLHPHNHEEYALARTERKNGNGYTGFLTFATPDITLEQDLERRDLTINAIALNENGEFFDPYGGKKDIISRTLRHVSNSFNEDPLRVLRVARFAASFAHLNFRIALETQIIMKEMSANGELEHLTAERIWKETEKALLTYNPQVYFQELYNCGALKILFPELENLYGIPAPIKWHPEIDTGLHSLMTLTIASVLSDKLDVRFATLFHDVGKALTPRENWPRHHGHSLAGLNIIKVLCDRLKIPNYIRDLALLVTEFHDFIHTIEKQSAEMIIELFDRIGAWRKPERVDKIAITSEADSRGRATFENTTYPQGNYLRQAFILASSVKSKDIIIEGFKGKEIQKELRRKRILAIKNGLKNFI